MGNRDDAADYISRMRIAIKEAELIGPPAREYKLHPDDYRALRAQCAPIPQFNADTGMPVSFAGVRIILDEKAERLPRMNAQNNRADQEHP